MTTEVLFQPPDDYQRVEDEVVVQPKPVEFVARPPGHVYEELFAANREVRRLRVCLNQIAHAPRKFTVTDIKAMANEALAKGKGE